MNELERLTITAACRDVIHRGAAAVDANDADGFAALFTEDGVLERPSGAPLQGREAVRQAYAARAPERITRHLVTNTLVEPDSPTEARATSLVLLWGGNAKDEAGPYGRPAEPRQMVGEFHDVLVRTDQGWRIARRRALFVLHASH
ncbi:nuclear transport factor 2 family protein [Ramlibacter sp. AW1]|uniref:Nuclear transport factor 2 family protein n=1 Tax=Ramlibacter aurantiacus TaxID=2801330 RepID=A0A936ZHR8_9BURK|nr:nuclear transport factor 2 family protein [Ramlibacter aurantiacus]MBL0420092.1 nuclear transport factor 2 family protein [Ramlibacter aurantiacus]